MFVNNQPVLDGDGPPPVRGGKDTEIGAQAMADPPITTTKPRRPTAPEIIPAEPEPDVTWGSGGIDDWGCR